MFRRTLTLRRHHAAGAAQRQFRQREAARPTHLGLHRCAQPQAEEVCLEGGGQGDSGKDPACQTEARGGIFKEACFRDRALGSGAAPLLPLKLRLTYVPIRPFSTSSSDAYFPTGVSTETEDTKGIILGHGNLDSISASRISARSCVAGVATIKALSNVGPWGR